MLRRIPATDNSGVVIIFKTRKNIKVKKLKAIAGRGIY